MFGIRFSKVVSVLTSVVFILTSTVGYGMPDLTRSSNHLRIPLITKFNVDQNKSKALKGLSECINKINDNGGFKVDDTQYRCRMGIEEDTGVTQGYYVSGVLEFVASEDKSTDIAIHMIPQREFIGLSKEPISDEQLRGPSQVRLEVSTNWGWKSGMSYRGPKGIFSSVKLAIIDLPSGKVIQEGVIGQNGVVVFSNIPNGAYKFRLTLPEDDEMKKIRGKAVLSLSKEGLETTAATGELLKDIVGLRKYNRKGVVSKNGGSLKLPSLYNYYAHLIEPSEEIKARWMADAKDVTAEHRKIIIKNRRGQEVEYDTCAKIIVDDKNLMPSQEHRLSYLFYDPASLDKENPTLIIVIRSDIKPGTPMWEYADLHERVESVIKRRYADLVKQDSLTEKDVIHYAHIVTSSIVGISSEQNKNILLQQVDSLSESTLEELLEEDRILHRGLLANSLCLTDFDAAMQVEEEFIAKVKKRFDDVQKQKPVIEGRIELKKEPSGTNWWERAKIKELEDNPTPWGYDPIVPVEGNKGVIKVTLTREMFEKYSIDNPEGRNLDISTAQYNDLGPKSIAGIRHKMNIINPHDTRYVKNTVERLLTSISLALMLKIKYNKGAYFPYQVNYGHEVRYNSEIFQDVTLRALAAMGFICHKVPNNEATAIWNTSTMGKFFSFPISFCGTSSHSESEMDGLKIMDYEGSQFLISDIKALIAIKDSIEKMIKKEGSFTFMLSKDDDPRITDQLYISTNNGMYVYKKYQEKTTADEFILNLIKTLDGSKVHIDCMHGSGYRTLTSFLKEMGLEDLIHKIDWLHTEERPDFGNIGKMWENIDKKTDELFDFGADGTKIKERSLPNGKLINYYPILCTADYPEILSNLPIGDIILPTDMDNDRLYYMQIFSNDTRTKALLDKIGVFYNIINEKKIAAIFIPNKAFHFLHEINFERIKHLMSEGKIAKGRTIVVVKTFASTPAIDEWAEARIREGYDVEVINTGVGFGKVANIMYKIEISMSQRPNEDVVIKDAGGEAINVGRNPLILTAWEESGGIITGIVYGFRDLLGKSFLAEREKSATESIFLSLALISKLQQENKGNVDFAEYLNHLYERDNIKTPLTYLASHPLFTVGNTEETEIGNSKKFRIFGAYLSLVIARMKNEISIDEVRTILEDIFNEEYQVSKEEKDSKLTELEKVRFDEINFHYLKDIWFTGDGVMFVFDDGTNEWQVLFRPSGTGPDLKSYGFGKNMQRLINDAWAFSNNENRKGVLPNSFISNSYLIKLWGIDGIDGNEANGVKAVNKAERMQQAWEDFGEVVDPEDLTSDQLDKLKQNRLIRRYAPPDNHLELVNNWLRSQGLPEVNIDLRNSPQTMPQKDIISLLQSVPESVYEQLGKYSKNDVLNKEGLNNKNVVVPDLNNMQASDVSL